MSVDIGGYEFFKLLLELFHEHKMVTESGCESRVNDQRSHVLFAARTVYTELVKHCLLNNECCALLRQVFLSIGPVKEVHGICDQLVRLTYEASRHTFVYHSTTLPMERVGVR